MVISVNKGSILSDRFGGCVLGTQSITMSVTRKRAVEDGSDDYLFTHVDSQFDTGGRTVPPT